MKNENLFNWIFNYNPYVDEWRACHRDNYLDLFDNRESENILKSKKIEILIEFITKQTENE